MAADQVRPQQPSLQMEGFAGLYCHADEPELVIAGHVPEVPAAFRSMAANSRAGSLD